MLKKEIIVEKDKKVSVILQDFGFSYADVNKILRNKDVKINGKAVKENIMVYQGDALTFFYTQDMLDKKYDVIFEDDDVCVIYKYAGIEVEGEKGLESVLKNAIAVHRLDRNTEGLMVFAKNDECAKKLVASFKKHYIHKFYVAEVEGNFDVSNKVFKAYLLKDSENSVVKIFAQPTKGAVEIETKIDTIKAGKESSLVKIELLTGKTHQIRAHLAFLGHPILGDGKYGKNETNKKFKLKRQKLACFKLKFDFVGIESLNFKEFERKPKWFCDIK